MNVCPRCRRPIEGDRRAYAVRLTSRGKRAFDTMATAHERWVVELLGGLDSGERKRLYALLDRVKSTIAARDAPAAEDPPTVTRLARASRNRNDNEIKGGPR